MEPKFVNPSLEGNKIPSELTSQVSDFNASVTDLLTKIYEKVDELNNNVKEVISNNNSNTVEQVQAAPAMPEVQPAVETVEQITPEIPEVLVPEVEVAEPQVEQNTVTPEVNQEPEIIAEPTNNDSNIISMDDLLKTDTPQEPSVELPEVPVMNNNSIEMPNLDLIGNAPAPAVETVAPVMPEVQPAPVAEPVAPVVPEVQPTPVAVPAVDLSGVEELKDFVVSEVISNEPLQRSFSSPAGFNEKFMAKSNANVMTLEKIA